MKNYQKIQPEVIVGLGEKTQFLEKVPPFRTVINLHIQLEDWLGDDLMECHPCYIVTQSLKEGLESSAFSGFEFSDLEVTKDEYFDNNYQINRPLPKFYWLKVIGVLNRDDMSVDLDSSLSISDELLSFLQRNYTLNKLDKNPQRNEFDDLLDKMIDES
jgi:hypothetical protein